MSKFETKLEWANGAEEMAARGHADAYRTLQIAVDTFKTTTGAKVLKYQYGRWSAGFDDTAKPATAPTVTPEMMAAFAAFMASQGAKVNGKAKTK